MADLRAAVATFDSRVDELFIRLRGRPEIDRIFYSLSALGDHGLIWLAIAIARDLPKPHRFRASLSFAALLGVESALVNGLIKSLFGRSRPVHEHNHPHHLRHPLTSSFPSGHASSAFMAATLLADGSKVPACYYALACGVALSRIHVRIHHASDVLAGAAIGLALGRLARRVTGGVW